MVAMFGLGIQEILLLFMLFGLPAIGLAAFFIYRNATQKQTPHEMRQDYDERHPNPEPRDRAP